ncbi:CDT1-like protein a, chloroplastic [Heracleum sosnowskyi]|uniref:CDT1-like protein a, chloroplastic n=1 Tax=Heracleum sosnowskyi TaxID=360622 RepID=A0AAD8IE84_9APIA|nr:CDT1-like protein a, chloroplastic [Heracleum sosnowskyi]
MRQLLNLFINKMEHIKPDQIEQTVKGENYENAAEKSSDLKSDILSRTPAKANETLPNKYRRDAAELPQKYKTISDFFDGMTTSVRLLSLRKKSTTFRNISTQVQILARREFLYKHLAQIKYILPEAVKTERILIHNEKNMCMEPEMKISLLFDIVEGHAEGSDYLALRSLFTSRLFNFLFANTESCEIPEAALPEPFNKGNINITADQLPLDSYTVPPPSLGEVESSKSCNLPPSFSRHFSQKAITETTQLLGSPNSLLPIKCDSLKQEDTEQEKESPASCVESTNATNPVYLPNPPCFSSITCESTPMKITCEKENLTVETPAQLTPQRSLPSCDVKIKTGSILHKPTSSVSAKRTLDFSYSEGKGRILDFGDGVMQHEEVAHDTMPGRETSDVVEKGCLAVPQLKVSSCCTSDDRITNQSGSPSRQQIFSCLPDIVNIINNIFQCANCSSITKEELVHKIIMNALDVVERREVEEQIDLLEKLVPDWIGKKLAPSGDILYNIKKVSDLKSVSERLICI